MNREDAKVVLAFMEDKTKNEDEQDALLMAIDALSVDGDTISRQDAIDAVEAVRELLSVEAHCAITERISALPSADAVQTDCTDFVNWLMEEVMDDENWELNAVALGEIIARKLKKLGLLEVKDGYYIRPSADAENESCGTCKYFETSHREYPCSDCTVGNSHYVSAEAVQGEWVRKYDDKVNCYWYECDQCGEYRPRNQFGHEYNANFCPNCGAKMKGGAE